MEVDQSQAKGGRSGPQGSRDRSLSVAALIFAILLSGCGVPGEPLPPLLEIPAPISDLSAVQVGARLRLTWSPPVLTTEGTRVSQLGRMEIHGAFLPHEASLTNFAEQSRLLATLGPGEISERQQQALLSQGVGGQVTYELSLTPDQLRQRAFFAVKAFNRKDKDGGFSNISSLEIADLPEPPLDLQATLTEKAIQLSWKAATLSAFSGPASPADGYRIYRSEAGSPQPAQEIGAAESLAYQDTSFEFGHTYVYFVRAFAGKGDSAALTPPSLSVEVAAIDRFPPAAPRNVRAVAEPGAIEMAWSPNAEPDFAGYNVYRSLYESRGGPFAKLNPNLLLIPIFRDPGITAGMRYVYHVTAVDKSGNEGAPSEDVTLTAE